MKFEWLIVALLLCGAMLVASEYGTLPTGSKCCPAGKSPLLLAEAEAEDDNGENGNGNGKEEEEGAGTGLNRTWDVVMLG